MSKIIRIPTLMIVSLLVARCALIPETSTQAVPTPPTAQSKSTTTPGISTTPEAPDLAAPSPTPGLHLPATDQVVLTIPNREPWFGREGDPRPDWKAWGAETFIIASDGTIWIADTAVYPNRLLHYSQQGHLLQEISLDGKIVYAYDLALIQDSIWLLDISAEPARVVQLSMEGEALSRVDINRGIMTLNGEYVSNGVFSLLAGEEGELLINGINGYYRLVTASGEIVDQPLEGLDFYGHTFQVGSYDQATGQVPIFVDGQPFETPPGFFIEAEPLLGFIPDGSFALAGHEQTAENQADFQVRYYHVSGESLGIARQYAQTFYKDWNHHLAFAADGSIYQLVSNPDHSVQIVRLGFGKSLSPPAALPLATPTPLSALPRYESPATDEEQARDALLAFFANLSAGNYAEAATQFGGELNEFMRDPLPGESVAAYWEYLCAYLWCLPVAEISEVEQVAEDQYLMYVVFMQTDGTRLEIGGCCGADPAATPPVWQFAYPVQKIDGVWKVMREPLFIP